MEKITRCLSVMFSSDFKSSRDPQQGYYATFADFVARSRDSNDVRPDGATVVIGPSGKSVTYRADEGFGENCNHICKELDAATAPDAWGARIR